MQIVALEPGVMEYGVNRDAYGLLLSDLDKHGYTAHLHQADERRDGVSAAAVADLVVRVLDEVGEAGIGALVTLILQHVGKSVLNKRRTRKAVIYGPKGEVLHQFTLRDPAE